MTREITLDTSAFVALSNDDSWSDFLEMLKGARLVLPADLLAELVVLEDEDLAWQRLSTVLDLGRRLGPDGAVCAPDLTKIFRRERKGNGVRRTPAMPASAVALQSLHVGNRQEFSSHREWMVRETQAYLNKKEVLAKDRAFRDELPHHAGAVDMSTVIGDIFNDYMQWFRLPCYCFRHVAKKTRNRRRMLAHVHQFRTTLAWAVCQDLTALGAVQRMASPGEIEWLEKPKRGAWSDNRIAATAAYSDHLVTNDRGQLRKLNFAAEQLGLDVRAVTLDDFRSAKDG